jgi:beta-carotene 3-hydroxylase
MAMEPWSRIIHGNVWHKRMWNVHHSHHKVPRTGFEWNDLLAMSHAPFSMALIIYGCEASPSFGREIAFGVGLGMAAFGALYITFHDGVCHERFPVGFLRKWHWVERLRKAHLTHHHTDGPPYGLFLGHGELAQFRESGKVLADLGRRSEVIERERSRAGKVGSNKAATLTEPDQQPSGN